MNSIRKEIIKRIVSQITVSYVDSVEYDESRDEIYLYHDRGDRLVSVAKLGFNYYGVEQLIYNESVTLEVQAIILFSKIDEDFGTILHKEIVDRLRHAMTEIKKMFLGG